jgi:two-component sensor histidine kinase
VEDDGVGQIDITDQPRRRGLGQRIIAGMADKLEGSQRYETLSPGTRAILTVPASSQIRVKTSPT